MSFLSFASRASQNEISSTDSPSPRSAAASSSASSLGMEGEEEFPEDLESKAFASSVEKSPEDLPDFGDYNQRLKEALETDLTDIQKTNCVGVGVDAVGRKCIYLMPALALRECHGNNDAKMEVMRKIMLLFIRIVDSIVVEPYTLVYGHSATPLLAQTAVLHSYYKILPRKFKKNLKEMVLLHPTFGIRTFFDISRYFVGEKFFRKLHFVECIATLQTVISPLKLQLPYAFIQWEENHFKMGRVANTTPPLSQLVDLSQGQKAPPFLVRCFDFLREHGGLEHEGIFRVPGDQVVLQLGIDRIRLDGGKNSILFAPPGLRSLYNKQVVADASVLAKEDLTPDAPVAFDGDQNFSDVKLKGVPRERAVLLVHDVDSVAQLIKAFLKDLPEPVISFNAYDEIVSATKEYGATKNSVLWKEKVMGVIEKKLPPAHKSTLFYLLAFLTEVALSSGTNKMTPGNIATVVGPNIMRRNVESDNPIVIMEEMKIGHKFTELLILENMNESLSAKIEAGVNSGSNRMAAVYRRSFASRGSEVAAPSQASSSSPSAATAEGDAADVQAEAAAALAASTEAELALDSSEVVSGDAGDKVSEDEREANEGVDAKGSPAVEELTVAVESVSVSEPIIEATTNNSDSSTSVPSASPEESSSIE